MVSEQKKNLREDYQSPSEEGILRVLKEIKAQFTLGKRQWYFFISVMISINCGKRITDREGVV